MITDPIVKEFASRSISEVNEIKRDHCYKKKCPYLKRLGGVGAADLHHSIGHTYCAYLKLAGERRNCLPENCEHYKDKNVVLRRRK